MDIKWYLLSTLILYTLTMRTYKEWLTKPPTFIRNTDRLFLSSKSSINQTILINSLSEAMSFKHGNPIKHLWLKKAKKTYPEHTFEFKKIHYIKAKVGTGKSKLNVWKTTWSIKTLKFLGLYAPLLKWAKENKNPKTLKDMDKDNLDNIKG